MEKVVITFQKKLSSLYSPRIKVTLALFILQLYLGNNFWSEDMHLLRKRELFSWEEHYGKEKNIGLVKLALI